MRSLRKTLVLGTSLATAATLVIAGALLYFLVRASLIAQFDQSLLDKAQGLASAVEREHGVLDIGFDDIDLREVSGDTPEAYLQLRLANGSTVYRSWRGSIDDIAPLGEMSMAPTFQRITLPDGRDGRSVMFRFIPRGEHVPQTGEEAAEETRPASPQHAGSTGTVDIVLARSTATLYKLLTYLEGFLLLVGCSAIAISTGVLWWVVRHSLHPLEKLAVEIGRFREDDLARRINLAAAPREIQPVVDRLNDLLRRLEEAFFRERAFSANVAHELRNPLAGLRLKMDLARSRAREGPQYEQTIDDCRTITAQMETMVENLLALARLEAGQFPVRHESLDLGRLVRDVWESLDAKARGRRLNVHWSAGAEVPVVSDPSLLRVVARNILENAVAYADDGGTLRIGIESTDGETTLSVSNSGSRLSDSQAKAAFEPFWRGDKARSETGVHCGLGLSLVRQIATTLDGTAVARSSTDGDFEVCVSIANRMDVGRDKH